MNEQHMKRIERVLTNASGTREQAQRFAAELARDGAEPHLLEALAAFEKALEEAHRALMQGTYFAAPQDRLREHAA